MGRGLLAGQPCANLGFCAVVRATGVPVRLVQAAVSFGVGKAVSEDEAADRAGVAQLVEHLICNQRVGGSNPFASSTQRKLRRSLKQRQASFTGACGLGRRACPLR